MSQRSRATILAARVLALQSDDGVVEEERASRSSVWTHPRGCQADFH